MKLKACQLFYLCTKTKDPHVWQAFIDHHGRRIRQLLAAALKCFGSVNRYELDDLAQDFYCRLLAVTSTRFRNWTDYQLWSYFNRIARNLIIDHHRATMAAKRRRDPFDSQHAGLERPVEAHHETPEETLLRREQQSRLNTLFSKVAGSDRLTPLKRRALRLALLDGWSSREIVDRLAGALSHGQIDAMIHRLRLRLAKEGLQMPRRGSKRRKASRRAAKQRTLTHSCRRIA